MYSDYILVIPNFSERNGVDANQLMVISDEEGLTLESAQVISAGVHAHVLSMMKTEVLIQTLMRMKYLRNIVCAMIWIQWTSLTFRNLPLRSQPQIFRELVGASSFH